MKIIRKHNATCRTWNGSAKQFKEYGDARDDLIDRLGDYCSYCEMHIPTPAVEHVQPKSKETELEREWTNFLLACVSCNSIKNDKTINAGNINDYFWADQDNTFRAFFYEKDRAPQISPNLDLSYQQIAKNTLELTGLDREHGHPKLTKADRRWKKRNEAWDDALSVKDDFISNPSEEMKKTIVRLAKAKGFWSVWMTVFTDDVDMRRRLIEGFKGTSRDCFDAKTQAIPRTGGKL